MNVLSFSKVARVRLRPSWKWIAAIVVRGALLFALVLTNVVPVRGGASPRVTVLSRLSGAAGLFGDSVRSRAADTTTADPAVPASQMTAASYAAAMESIAWSNESTHGLHPVVNGHLILRSDSVAIVVDSMTRVWLAALHQSHAEPPRMQLNLAALQFYLGRDTEAIQGIARWLAQPGATVEDSAVAFGMAVDFATRTFGGAAPTSARVALARQYVTRLEALPVQATQALFGARTTMLRAYMGTGEADSAVAVGLRAYAMLPRIRSYELRARLASGEAIVDLAQVLAGRPHGLAKIDSLLAFVKQQLVPPPTLVAQDTALPRLAQALQEEFANSEAKLRWFGHQAPPIVATHWFNQPRPSVVSDAAPGAHVLPIADGTIRIIGFGWLGCPGCMVAMAKLERDQHLLPRGVTLQYYEWTLGAWGSNFAEPEEEAEHLRHLWLERKHFTFPIMIWAGPKDSTAGGGLLPRESPTKVALNIDAGPTFIVIDGHGIVRHRQPGYGGYTHDFEKLITELVRERAHERAHEGIHAEEAHASAQ